MPAAVTAAAISERPERLGINLDNGRDWIETTETDSAGRVVRFLRPPELAARGPVMGYGYSSFDRDPTTGEIVFSGWQWFDW